MMPDDWEGNRRFGVALHWRCVTDFGGLFTFGLNGVRLHFSKEHGILYIHLYM